MTFLAAKLAKHASLEATTRTCTIAASSATTEHIVAVAMASAMKSGVVVAAATLCYKIGRRLVPPAVLHLC